MNVMGVLEAVATEASGRLQLQFDNLWFQVQLFLWRTIAQMPSSLCPLHISFLPLSLMQEALLDLINLEHVVQTHRFSPPALDINSGEPKLGRPVSIALGSW